MSNKNLLNATLLFVMDGLSLWGLFYLAVAIRSHLKGPFIPPFHHLSLSHFAFVLVIILFLFYNEKIYSFRYDFWQETKKIIKSLFLSYLLTLTLLALMKSNYDYSRLFITIYFLLGMLLIPLIKRLTKRLLYRHPLFQKRVLLLGDPVEKQRFAKEFQTNFYLGQSVVEQDYDTVIIISKGLTTQRLHALTQQYMNQKDGLYIVPYMTQINFAHSCIMEYGNLQNNAIHVQNRLLIKHNIWIKNLFDKLFSLLLLPPFLLIHLLISIAIKVDSRGSIFFRQTRLGQGGKPFVCYKYRTMYQDSNRVLEAYLQQHPQEVAYYATYHKYQNDPRITTVGRILRATSLDELPQLINILRGEMSWVGPRPYMLDEAAALGEKKELILRVKPGITGLWQVSGRNELTFEERNNLEVWYIKNWLLWDDFIILLKTISVVLMRVGAK